MVTTAALKWYTLTYICLHQIKITDFEDKNRYLFVCKIRKWLCLIDSTFTYMPISIYVDGCKCLEFRRPCFLHWQNKCLFPTSSIFSQGRTNFQVKITQTNPKRDSRYSEKVRIIFIHGKISQKKGTYICKHIKPSYKHHLCRT